MDVVALTLKLDLAVRRLGSRARAESGWRSWVDATQLAALCRVVDDGPITSELAAAEYMRSRSIAQTVAELLAG